MAKNDGGSAFPGYSLSTQDYGPGVRVPPRPYKGMSLRDWFAGQALSGLARTYLREDAIHNPDDLARIAVALADAMLAEREKEGESCDDSSAG